MITLTQKAATHITSLGAYRRNDATCLRIAVVGGGCSGFQYQLSFDTENEDDQRFESNGIRVIIDRRFIAMLDGIEIDYVESLEGSSFAFNNPNATGGCGCGKSFSC